MSIVEILIAFLQPHQQNYLSAGQTVGRAVPQPGNSDGRPPEKKYNALYSYNGVPCALFHRTVWKFEAVLLSRSVLQIQYTLLCCM